MANRIIFVSRRNSLRSLLAQACLRHLGSDRFSAISCGQPGQVGNEIHPAALAVLNSAKIRIPPVRPQGWDQLLRHNLRADFVITLDEPTQAIEPMWPGQPYAALWSFPDAAACESPEEAYRLALQTLFALRRRLELMNCLTLHGADSAAVRSDIRDLGHME